MADKKKARRSGKHRNQKARRQRRARKARKAHRARKARQARRSREERRGRHDRRNGRRSRGLEGQGHQTPPWTRLPEAVPRWTATVVAGGVAITGALPGALSTGETEAAEIPVSEIGWEWPPERRFTLAPVQPSATSAGRSVPMPRALESDEEEAPEELRRWWASLDAAEVAAWPEEREAFGEVDLAADPEVAVRVQVPVDLERLLELRQERVGRSRGAPEGAAEKALLLEVLVALGRVDEAEAVLETFDEAHPGIAFGHEWVREERRREAACRAEEEALQAEGFTPQEMEVVLRPRPGETVEECRRRLGASEEGWVEEPWGGYWLRIVDPEEQILDGPGAQLPSRGC